MKNLKKLASLLLALVMVFSLATTAFAAEVDNKTNHSYNAYQIFSGTQAEGESALGDVDWGVDINGSAFLTALQADSRFEKKAEGAETATNIFASCVDAADVADVLAENTDVASAFANVADQNLKSDATPTAIAADAGSVTLDAGYYLLVDTTDVDGKTDAKNTALLQVTNADKILIQAKYDVPSSDKDITAVTPKVTDQKVDLKDDTTGEGVDGIDAGMGDTVEFTLIGTLPNNYADYETYTYNFHDTMSDGLTYVANSAKVYVDNNGSRTEITTATGVSVNTVNCGTDGCGCNWNVKINNLKGITTTTITAASKIVVVYSATLNTSAAIGAAGNTNEMYVEYSNNPNKDSDGNPDTGKTPKDEALVFTYELDTTKVDGTNTATKLKDAEFVLLNSNQTLVAKISDGKLDGWVADTTIIKNEDGTYPAEYTVKSAETTGLFTITGLDAGTYYLKETKAPAGYNLLTDPVEIVIAATVTQTEATGASLTALNIKVGDATEATDGVKDENTGEYTGVVEATIINNQGGTLPETGGMGTTLFYVFGGIMVLAAVVLLVTKKRMSTAE